MIYDFEWPKTAEDFERLFKMKSFDLQQIFANENDVDKKWFTQGIEFIFHGETKSITFGSLVGAKMTRALFKSSE